MDVSIDDDLEAQSAETQECRLSFVSVEIMYYSGQPDFFFFLRKKRKEGN